MSVPETVTNYLHANGIDFQLVSHQPTRFSAETAHAAHVPGEQLAKAVVLRDGERYLLAVVPASRHVDPEAVARIFGRRFSLVDEDDFPVLFRDCRPGAIPPLGEAYGIPTIVDDELTAPPEIYLEAGDHEHLILLGHAAFLTLIETAERGRISYQA